MDKDKTVDIYKELAKTLEGESITDALEIIGCSMGLFAKFAESEHGVDRAVVFKMIQRYGHNAIKMIEAPNA